ncbi:hypothetical protein SEA_ADGERS_102 [Gordonia phage Adgers]|uniref:Uncharacterized protein n=7 Tax=Montyvirus TaxID=2733196 RepID=A0A2L1IVK0_9CAUD|nr:hypothetical protein HOS74_gp031 [Gordonia phage Flakey]YP_009837068.1 hypothetical protein HWB50_gp032 [Gordonia phage Adgers]YP_009843094.1 hypothetical protein HWC02_gp032 [Gordonia phage Sombrero]YP_009848383.1 hypothetical protein HWC39_gp031 [Gordonia phage Beaver]YP_009856389.1 hypothetical protein HWD07_gp031 [Gordonia phage John316]QAY16918.1 hypothetical protein SEA_EXIGUO_98 [Gordonia phage Exiguo]QDF17943.1 hypothetical protein SEA_GORKO_98 [Gordonia phage Gorko]QIQ62805.1 hyp
MALPNVAKLPEYLVPDEWPTTGRYRVATWRAGRLIQSDTYETLAGALGGTEAWIRLCNPNTTRELVWTRLGKELKLSFAVWREGDTVAYVTDDRVT